MIHGLAHVALYTDKFEETVGFYKKAFHASEIDRFAKKNGCMLLIGDFCLEIFEGDKRLSDGSFGHIALQCDSVDDVYRYAVSQGAEPLVEPVDISMKLIKRIAFVKGINGEQIELCETV